MLTLTSAQEAANAIVKKALENNLSFAISIYDNHGNLKYFLRMDNTSFGSISISQLKGYTSSFLPYSTKDLAKKNTETSGNPYNHIPDILLIGGALPIIDKNGKHIGAIGLCGASPEIDEMYAKIGLEAISD